MSKDKMDNTKRLLNIEEECIICQGCGMEWDGIKVKTYIGEDGKYSNNFNNILKRNKRIKDNDDCGGDIYFCSEECREDYWDEDEDEE